MSSVERYLRKHYRREYIAPCVGDIESYHSATPPSKHNTILGCNDEYFLKEIYAVETNKEWRKMCVQRISDKDFLEKVAKTDPSTRVRKQAAKSRDSGELLYWLRDNDPSKEIRDYAKMKIDKLPKSMRFILE